MDVCGPPAKYFSPRLSSQAVLRAHLLVVTCPVQPEWSGLWDDDFETREVNKTNVRTANLQSGEFDYKGHQTAAEDGFSGNGIRRGTSGRNATTPIAILDEAQVRSLTSLSRTTRWRLERRGEFPQHVRLSPGRVGWRQGDIEAWIGSRAA